MNPLDDLLESEPAPADDGVALVTELVVAVTWLRRGAMPGLTIWSALDQAIRLDWHTAHDWAATDPLRGALQLVVNEPSGPSVEQRLDTAIRGWLGATATIYNEGYEWSAPIRVDQSSP
jgi:hypothetical protein